MVFGENADLSCAGWRFLGILGLTGALFACMLMLSAQEVLEVWFVF
jgi:hypothetical protein